MKIDDILAQERRARMAAERLLAQKQAELSDANRQLSLHARNLSEEIVETREEVEEARSENSLVKADLERATKEVVIAKRRLWDSLETIEDGFAVFDRNECMIAANSAYLKPFDGLECIAPGITYIEILQAALDEGVVDTEGLRPLVWRDMMLARWRAPMIEPHTLRLWDGTYVKMVDRRSEDGDTVSLGLDITDTIKYEAKLKDARFKAEAANRAKSAFLANMSHEIRTPMNGVVAIAELMAEGDLDEEQRLYVDTIKKSGEALLTIINDVLDYSKGEAAKLSLHPEEFDLESKIHNVVALLQPSVQEKGLEMSIDFDIFMPTKIKGDPVRIGQILTNLIGNAVKFTSQGYVLIRVLGLPMGDGGQQKIHITVEDSGIGIPVNMQDHIFGEFNQVEDERNRKFDGTGLGLAITKQLVDLMGGEIWVDSEEGKGACFGLHVTLPVVEDVNIPNLPLGLEKALLIMEEGLHQSILDKSLRALGLEVTHVTELRDLPGPLDRQQVVFMQENLPNQKGREILEAIRQTQCLARVVLLTVPNAASIMKSEFQDVIDETLNMPILRHELFRTLESVDLRPHQAPSQNIMNVLPRDQNDETAQAIATLVADPSTQPTPDPSPTLGPVEPAQASLTQRAMRVLAAEDNRTNQLVFSKLVKSLDIDLKFANNGREAVELFEEFEPDLIFMDISMPDMDGKEATRHIRALEDRQGLERTKIVALTAHAMTGDAEEILSHGLDKHLTKPLKKHAIFEEISASCPEWLRHPIPAE
ncbi:ATP-binding protein [Aliiroseovarius sp. KMU-50]|uniref:histidine kinase n=1 Tax=Aliiroseovarius salicola TaxID=3009082 RepID=A0ABT4W4J7_9RHOB|nr:ATP-binding protein [Aliiroseovarius sp. KMU-50]MDA5095406.1 ATP-binding protein [Aliiroseovarius sp. KMU-50]